jgi:HlyD family secretion protein
MCAGALAIALSVLLAGCWENPEGNAFQGYVEGEFVEVAPEIGGRIVELAVRRGDIVEAHAPLFRLDAAEAEAAVAEAEADLAREQAELANLKQGQRPPELAVIDARIAEAEAALAAARREFDRQLVLNERRVASEAQLDQAREAVTVAEARVAAAEREKEVATLPARAAEIEAGQRSVEAARAAREMAKTRLAKHAVAAPVAGRVEDVYFELGEVAAGGMPVVSLLPADGRKVIFFVPEAARPSLPLDALVRVACDGCPTGLTARVTFMATEAEFTPPVIFSRDTREKLVFRAEAGLSGEAGRLPLGQPVDVLPAGEGDT